MTDLPTRARDALRALHEQGRVAAPWLPGMLVCRGRLVDVWPDADESLVVYPKPDSRLRQWRPDDLWPDLDDPATLGCLLALVREVCQDDMYHLEVAGEHAYFPDGGCIAGWYDSVTSRSYDTEAEALVAALEALAEVDRG